MSQPYRVRLEAFEGPMDLLLYLIRSHEVDIHDIPISTITDQYIGFLDDVDRIDIDVAGEFLVMASTLMEVKSRILAAEADRKDRGDEEEGDTPIDEPGVDPRAELVQQLLAYKKYRDAADALQQRQETWEKRYPVKAAGIDDDAVREAADEMGELEMEDLDLSDLVEAFRQILSSVNFDRLGEHEVLSDDTPLEVHASNILENLQQRSKTGNARALRLRSMIVGKTRAECVGMFLAILVLVRDQRVSVSMNEGEVEMELKDADDQNLEIASVVDEFD
ncbi:MAG: segregation/condensation protein A [bacterium]|nr:segregation/condensation protein A [bacterium]